MNHKLFSSLTLLAALTLIPFAQAQTTYTIPLEPRGWGGPINVQIQSTPTWAHNIVLHAMTTWNEAQAWFRDTYYPHTSIYTLVEATISGDAIVTFTNTLTPEGWRGSTKSIQEGLTRTIIDVQWGPDYTNTLALHELGRVLGLDSAIYSQDLMNIVNIDRIHAPSTLDLYGVHLLAGGSQSTSATLPANIPYYLYPLVTATTSYQTWATQTVSEITTSSSTTSTMPQLLTSQASNMRSESAYFVLVIVTLAVIGLAILFMREHLRRKD